MSLLTVLRLKLCLDLHISINSTKYKNKIIKRWKKKEKKSKQQKRQGIIQYAWMNSNFEGQFEFQGKLTANF